MIWSIYLALNVQYNLHYILIYSKTKCTTNNITSPSVCTLQLTDSKAMPQQVQTLCRLGAYSIRLLSVRSWIQIPTASTSPFNRERGKEKMRGKKTDEWFKRFDHLNCMFRFKNHLSVLGVKVHYCSFYTRTLAIKLLSVHLPL